MNAVNGPLWYANRLTREERQVMGRVAVDGDFLAQCGRDVQGLLIDSCSPERAAEVLCDAVSSVQCGMIWTIASSDVAYESLRRAAKQRLEDGRWLISHQMYDVHPLFQDATQWAASGIRMLLTTTFDLRARTARNTRKRDDVLQHYVPLVSLVDPELSFCSRRRYFDYSSVVQDVVSRICALHGPTPVAVFTARPTISLNTQLVRTSLGVDGLIYLSLD